MNEQDHRDGIDDDDEDDLTVERYAGGFLKGVMKVVGYSVLAVIAGYSAGIAMDNCMASRNRSTLTPTHAR
jgi:hypothetical protein